MTLEADFPDVPQDDLMGPVFAQAVIGTRATFGEWKTKQGTICPPNAQDILPGATESAKSLHTITTSAIGDLELAKTPPRPHRSLRSREPVRGEGSEARRVRRLLDLPENSDIRGFNVNNHEYATALRPIVGDLRFVPLRVQVIKLATEHSIDLPRTTTRSLALMVKWLYQNRGVLGGTSSWFEPEVEYSADDYF
jgi:hypothetical protein